MCDFFDDGIGAEEMGIILGITDELDEEARAKQLDKENEPLTPDEMLKTPFDYLNDEDI